MVSSVVRSLAFYGVFYLGTVFYVLAALLALPLGEKASRRIPDAWSRFHRWCVNAILGIEVLIEGERPSGPVLLAIKHESFFEAIDLAAMFEYPVPFGKKELYDIPLWGRVALGYGAVPVARDKGARALREMMGLARGFVDKGRPLALFPEGSRVPHGARPPLKSGFAGIYKLVGVPVVPVAVDSGPLYQRRWKRKGIISYRFGELIPPGLPRDEVEARVHAAINALNA